MSGLSEKGNYTKKDENKDRFIFIEMLQTCLLLLRGGERMDLQEKRGHLIFHHMALKRKKEKLMNE